MNKIDLKLEMKHLYQASAKTVAQVDVPPLTFLMIDGIGDPNTSPAYAQAVEGLWWADDMAVFAGGDKSQWQRTMMILQPAFVVTEIIDRALVETRNKKNLPALDQLRLQEFHEGPCAQLLHVGPFSEEGPSIARLPRFIDATARRSGKHHEIYLSDIRRADPKK